MSGSYHFLKSRIAALVSLCKDGWSGAIPINCSLRAMGFARGSTHPTTKAPPPTRPAPPIACAIRDNLACLHSAARQRGQVFDAVADLLACETQFVELLQVEPELRAGAEPVA